MIMKCDRQILVFILLLATCLPVAHAAMDWSKASIGELRRAAKQGDASAQNYLGRAYYEGHGVPRDYSKAAKWLRKAAEQGNAEAQNDMGVLYDNGNGVPLNHATAAVWYQKSANQDFTNGLYNLGLDYAQGVGVSRDYAKAVELWRKAANQGDLDSQFYLCYFYYKGLGVSRSYVQAAKWCQKPAEQGKLDAQIILGNLYVHGRGVPQSFAKADNWFRKAAEQGNAVAQENLGISYGQGLGVPQDYALAAKWWRKGAEQGNAACEFNLAELYYQGLGVNQSIKKGLYWNKLAVDQGYPGAKLLLQKIEKNHDAHGPLEVVKSRAYWMYLQNSGLCVPAAAFVFKNVGRNVLGTIILRATFINPSKKRIFSTGLQWVNSSGELPEGYTLGAMVYGTVGYSYALGGCLKNAQKLHAIVTAQIFNTGKSYTLLKDVPVASIKSLYTYYSDQSMDGWVRNLFKTH